VQEGLLLHRVHVDRAGVAVNQGIVKALAVLPDPALAPVAVRDLAVPGAELALHHALGEHFIEGGWGRAAKTLADFLGRGGLRKPGESEEGQGPGAAGDKGPAA
jgi:hypothetical protein